MDKPPFEYSPINRRRKLSMPNGARVAVWAGINIEYYDFLEPIGSIRGETVQPPNPSAYGWYQYGMRVGVFRLMDILSAHGMRASVLLNSDVCAAYPEIIEAGNDNDWVWLGHSKRNRINPHSFATKEEEQIFLTEMVEEIVRSTGKQPRGWLGPGMSESHYTLDILADLGLDYVCDWVADDQPFRLQVSSGKMINVPYAVDGLNDVRQRGEAFSGRDYYELIVDQFDQLYADGASNPRVMCLAIHPHITGQPFRATNFNKALDYIAGHAGVWFPTSDEIADWYYESEADA